MTVQLGDVFADAVFWIALVVRQDQYHARAQELARLIGGRIVTSRPVLLETLNFLGSPARRMTGAALLEQVQSRSDIFVEPLSDDLWRGAVALYRSRLDKGWGLTDCTSFVTMQKYRLVDALTADEHFAQAGFNALMASPPQG